MENQSRWLDHLVIKWKIIWSCVLMHFQMSVASSTWHQRHINREQYDFIIHKKESYFELLVIFKSWLHLIYTVLSCPSAKIPTLKKLTFVPFCITTHKWLIQLQSKCRKKGKYILGKWFLINMSQIRVVNRI